MMRVLGERPLAALSPDGAKRRRDSWRMLVFAMIGVCCCSSPVVLIPISLFIKPWNETFGWSRAEIAVALTVAALGMAAANRCSYGRPSGDWREERRSNIWASTQRVLENPARRH